MLSKHRREPDSKGFAGPFTALITVLLIAVFSLLTKDDVIVESADLRESLIEPATPGIVIEAPPPSPTPIAPSTPPPPAEPFRNTMDGVALPIVTERGSEDAEDAIDDALAEGFLDEDGCVQQTMTAHHRYLDWTEVHFGDSPKMMRCVTYYRSTLDHPIDSTVRRCEREVPDWNEQHDALAQSD